MNKCDYCNKELTYMNGYFVCSHCQEYKQEVNATLTRQKALNILLEQNERLIYSQAWKYAWKYNMEIEDTKSQAFLIFCEALDRFDGRSRFITFLSWRLMTLNDYCRREKALLDHENIEPKKLDNGGNDIEENPEWMLKEDKTAERLAFYQVVESLSRDGQDVVEHLIYGSFTQPKEKWQRDTGKYKMQEVLVKDWGWAKDRVEGVWNEIQGWYKENFEGKSIIGIGGLIPCKNG